MADTLFFVSADAEQAEQLADPYRQRGWEVICTPPSDDALDTIASSRPLAAVFSLDPHCGADESRHLAETVVSDPRVLRPLVVFLGGDADQIAQAKASMPFGVFVREEELAWVLKHLAYKS